MQICFLESILNSGETFHRDVAYTQKMTSVEEYIQSIPTSTTISEWIYT